MGSATSVKLLLVTMYFPPAAGGGVQRALKLATHLPSLGIETHVLTPRPSKWFQQDATVPPPPGVKVHRARDFGPRPRLRGRELHGRGRLGRLAVEARMLPRRALVPDGEVLWNLTAIPAALRIIRREGIGVVLTTSPPVSLHLLGAAVQRLTRARWVADLRDPVLSTAFRRKEVRGERRVAKLVARRADAVLAATQGTADEIAALGRACRLEVVWNGCDAEDFDGLPYRRGDRFRITHAGSLFSNRDARPFLDALAASSTDVVARFVGDFRDSDWDYVRRLGLEERIVRMPFMSRREALALQRDSEALLLLVSDANGRGRTVLTGKLFEYLAAERPIIAAAPLDGEAAELIRSAGAGIVVAPDDAAGLALAIAELERRWRKGDLAPPVIPTPLRGRLSRRNAAERVAEVVRDMDAGGSA